MRAEKGTSTGNVYYFKIPYINDDFGRFKLLFLKKSYFLKNIFKRIVKTMANHII